MPYVDFALKKGFIPVFDLKNVEHPDMLLDPEDFGKVNAWELYFEQPQKKYSLDEVLHSRKVIIAPPEPPKFFWKENILNTRLPLPKEDFNFWRKMYEICPFSSEIISYAEELKQNLFPKGKKILAVSYRRSFEWCHYQELEFVPKGSHPIRGTLASIIKDIERMLSEFHYEYFFFTVDDREALETVRQHFGSACVSTERCIGHFYKDGKPISKEDIPSRIIEYNKRAHDVRLRAKEYLADVYLCAQCDSFFSCGSSADMVAYLINNGKFEHFVQGVEKLDSETHVSDFQNKVGKNDI